MAIENFGNGGMVITGEHINHFRMLTLRQGLKAEKIGMRLTRGRSCLSIVKAEFGIKARNAEAALPLFEAILTKHGIPFRA